jgi:hypothetical protein
VIGPVRQGLRKASSAGLNRCMKAVATMTPEPKYLAMKKAQSGIRNQGFCFAKTGKVAPSVDPNQIMKIEAIRNPNRPS